MSLLRRHHLVIANMIRPAGVDRLFSADDVESPDQIYDRIGGHLRWHKLQETQKRLRTRGVPLSLLSPDRLAMDLVTQYGSVKRRQLL